MKRAEIFLMVLQVPLDFILLMFAAISAFSLRFAPLVQSRRPIIFDLTLFEFVQTIIPIAILGILFFAFFHLYTPDPNRKLMADLHRIFLACSVGLAAVALYVFFTQEVFESRFLALFSWFFAIFYVSLGRLMMRGIKGLLYRSDIGVRRIVVIGDAATAQHIVQALKARKEFGYAIIGQFERFTSAVKKELMQLKPDEILLTNPRARESETIQAIEFANKRHIIFKYSADLFDAFSTNMTVHPLAGVPIVELRRTALDGWGRVFKRCFDSIVSLILLILCSPLMLITALIILLETGRPIIYKNERVGIRGKKFFLFKFRSMYQKDSTGSDFGGEEAAKKEADLIKSNNSKTGPIYKIKDDPRVTPFGRFIRRWSIDELPQLWNVLENDMSLVGPRPHQPREVQQYDQDHPHVFTLKPGMTGLAQISGRSDLSFEEEMKLDIYYIEKWSPLLDCVIFVKTPFVVLKKRKAL